jgi:hypothetical protein
LKNFELNELKITAGSGTNLRFGVTTNNPPPVVVEALPIIVQQTIKQYNSYLIPSKSINNLIACSSLVKNNILPSIFMRELNMYIN